jgi:hypothetical protein
MVPSRVLIANIKNMGQCPCPRCKVTLVDIKHLGKDEDTQTRADIRKPTRGLFRVVRKARREIFKGYKVSGTRVERAMQSSTGVENVKSGWSRVPTNVSAGTPLPFPSGMLIAGQERVYELHSWPQRVCIAHH